MALFLVRHGKNLSKDKDPDQGLSEQGIYEVNQMATIVKKSGIHISRIDHSVKTRAFQTAGIFASALEPEGGLNEISGLNPLDDVTTLADTIDCKEDVMLVGHLPFMERLAAYLITGTTDNRVFKFQNSGILCLDKDTDNRSWVIRWALVPDIKI